MRSTRDKVGILLGTANFGLAYGIAAQRKKLGHLERLTLVSEALKLGYLGLDTAFAYGDAEAHLGAMRLPQSAMLLTKFSLDGVATAEEIFGKFKLAEKRLGRAPDIFYFHSANQAKQASRTVLEETMKLIAAISPETTLGASVYCLEDINALFESKPMITAFQLPANVFMKRALARIELPKLIASGIHVAVRSIFLQGMLLSDQSGLSKFPLTSRERTLILQFQNECKKMGLGPEEVTIRYFLEHLGVNVVVGAHSQTELIDTSRFGQQRIDYDSLPDFGEESLFDLREARFN